MLGFTIQPVRPRAAKGAGLGSGGSTGTETKPDRDAQAKLVSVRLGHRAEAAALKGESRTEGNQNSCCPSGGAAEAPMAL